MTEHQGTNGTSTNGTIRSTILIVDDTPANLSVLLESLESSGYDVLVARDGSSAVEQASYARPDLILLDVMMPGMNGFETCQRLKKQERTRDIPVIFMTALAETRDKVKGFEAGAVDYITKPFQQLEVTARVATHLELATLRRRLEEKVIDRTVELRKALAEVEELRRRLEEENQYLREEIRAEQGFSEIIGRSEALQKSLRKVEQVAPLEATVLILGETGTGKELVARAIHDRSPRRNRVMVKVNCAALPPSLIESELFGHEKGSFTGATTRRRGRFELADQGTIFLDEIGEMPLELQAKMLRVLQEGEVEPIGAEKPVKVNVRVIAATHRDLQNVVERAVILSVGGTAVHIDDLLSQADDRPAPNDGNSSRLEDVERNHIRRVLDETEGRVDGPGGAAERLDLNPSTLRSRMRKLGISRK